MERFIEKHEDKIVGVLECFDRILLKGYLPFATGRALEAFLDRHGILYKDFKRFVLRQSELVKDHARAMAQRHGRPFEPIHPRERKEDRARRIAQRDGITSGLVCVFTAVEASSSSLLRRAGCAEAEVMQRVGVGDNAALRDPPRMRVRHLVCQASPRFFSIVHFSYPTKDLARGSVAGHDARMDLPGSLMEAPTRPCVYM